MLTSRNYQLAVTLCKEILTIKPDTPIVLNNLAWASAEMNDPSALEYAEQANKLLPNVPGIMDTLGWILVERGDIARGLPLLQKAAEMAPSALGIRLNLAKALMRAGQKAAARKELEFLDNNVSDPHGKEAVATLMRQL